MNTIRAATVKAPRKTGLLRKDTRDARSANNTNPKRGHKGERRYLEREALPPRIRADRRQQEYCDKRISQDYLMRLTRHCSTIAAFGFLGFGSGGFCLFLLLHYPFHGCGWLDAQSSLQFVAPKPPESDV